MSDKQDKVSAGARAGKAFLRLLSILVLAALIGAILNRISAGMDHAFRPAGFTQGVLQGALMPMAMPNLLVGRDINIYSQNNTGVSYKLGYTTGVNSCGAIFFGLFFWRVSRWRQRATQKSVNV